MSIAIMMIIRITLLPIIIMAKETVLQKSNKALRVLHTSSY